MRKVNEPVPTDDAKTIRTQIIIVCILTVILVGAFIYWAITPNKNGNYITILAPGTDDVVEYNGTVRVAFFIENPQDVPKFRRNTFVGSIFYELPECFGGAVVEREIEISPELDRYGIVEYFTANGTMHACFADQNQHLRFRLEDRSGSLRDVASVRVWVT